MKGKELNKLFFFSNQKHFFQQGFLITSSNLKLSKNYFLTNHNSSPFLEHLDQQPIINNKKYRIIMPSYLYQGGDGYLFLHNYSKIKESNMSIVNIL
jgi:hypothetical protein